MSALLVDDSLMKYVGRYTQKEGIVTRSLSGAKVADIPDLAWDMENFKCIIVHVGINDLAYMQVLDNFSKLVDIIRKQNPRAVVLLSGVTPRYRNRWRQGRGNHDALNDKAYTLNEKVKHLCRENGLTYVGHPNFMSSGRVRQEFIACDGLHLRPAGQKQMASDIICALSVVFLPPHVQGALLPRNKMADKSQLTDAPRPTTSNQPVKSQLTGAPRPITHQ